MPIPEVNGLRKRGRRRFRCYSWAPGDPRQRVLSCCLAHYGSCCALRCRIIACTEHRMRCLLLCPTCSNTLVLSGLGSGCAGFGGRGEMVVVMVCHGRRKHDSGVVRRCVRWLVNVLAIAVEVAVASDGSHGSRCCSIRRCRCCRDSSCAEVVVALVVGGEAPAVVMMVCGWY